jgi:hypothetical protein
MFTHTKLHRLIPLDHQINHCLAIQLIMIAVEFNVGMDSGTVVLGIFVGEFGHLEVKREKIVE